MQAIILAGGLGTRLRSVVNDRPKPMALINDKPFLEYLLRELKKNNITRIIFAVGYKGSMVEEYFRDGRDFGIEIVYSYEEGQLGTAGAIKNARNFITEDEFFVLNGDTFYIIDYSRLKEVNESGNNMMSLVVREVNDISRYGRALVKNQRLITFNEKTNNCEKGTINGGIYYMNKEIFKFIGDGFVSLENEVIPYLLENNINVGGIVNDGYFIDIGVPEDYYRFAQDIVKLN